MNFNAAAAQALFDDVSSLFQALGLFQAVDTHEPENAPGNRIYCSVTLGPLKAEAAVSGLAAASGSVTLMIRIWSAAMQRPLDKVDPEALAAAAALMGALAGSFSLDGSVRNVDIFSLTATPAWADFQGKQFRVIELPVPIIINDMFEEAA